LGYDGSSLRLDSPLLFPAVRGGYIELGKSLAPLDARTSGGWY
jgi:hypothetical protein